MQKFNICTVFSVVFCNYNIYLDLSKTNYLHFNINNNSYNVKQYSYNCIYSQKFILNFYMESLIDIAVLDMLKEVSLVYLRYTVNYLFLSLKNCFRLSFGLRVFAGMNIFSLSLLYKSSNWLEREIWDFYGIFFDRHLDLRRILNDYGFIGFPLRKDFPGFGFKEIVYDSEVKNLLYVPVILNSYNRISSYLNPWKKNLFNKNYMVKMLSLN